MQLAEWKHSCWEILLLTCLIFITDLSACSDHLFYEPRIAFLKSTSGERKNRFVTIHPWWLTWMKHTIYHSTDLNLFQQPSMELYEPETSKGGETPTEYIVGEPRTVWEMPWLRSMSGTPTWISSFLVSPDSVDLVMDRQVLPSFIFWVSD